jgi:hypothetical protein
VLAIVLKKLWRHWTTRGVNCARPSSPWVLRVYGATVITKSRIDARLTRSAHRQHSSSRCKTCLEWINLILQGVSDRVGEVARGVTHQDRCLHATVAAHELLVETTTGVILERASRLADDNRSGLLAGLFTLQITLKSIEEEAVVGHREPVEDFLLGR